MEFTQENFDKLLEFNKNQEKALLEERGKRKQTKERLEELEKFKSELDEKKLKDKWKFEELLNTKEQEIETYKTKLQEIEGKLPEYEGYKTKFEWYLQSQLDNKLSSIPEDKKEFVSKVIDWKDFESKVELLDWFVKEYSKPSFSWNAPDKWKDVSWVETAPKNMTEAISKAPVIWQN